MTQQTLSESISEQVPVDFRYSIPEFFNLDFGKWQESGNDDLIWLKYLMMQCAGQCAIFAVTSDSQSRDDIEAMFNLTFAQLLKEQIDYENEFEIEAE